jgi:hypothetical protein
MFGAFALACKYMSHQNVHKYVFKGVHLSLLLSSTEQIMAILFTHLSPEVM